MSYMFGSIFTLAYWYGMSKLLSRGTISELTKSTNKNGTIPFLANSSEITPTGWTCLDGRSKSNITITCTEAVVGAKSEIHVTGGRPVILNLMLQRAHVQH